jgi:two-component system, NarL family, capsular synthesis sensor histidine kinase RcsC
MAMRGSRRCKGLFLAAVILLALAAPALAAPAGSEYVPKVPKAAGEEILRGTQGPGGTVLSPEVRGADAANTSASGEASSGTNGSDANGSDANGSDANVSDANVSETGAAGTAPGAADTLLDPVVLLLIAGVAAAALSMTLRQKHSVSADPDAGGAASDPGSAPATPDGEIVDREPRS